MSTAPPSPEEKAKMKAANVERFTKETADLAAADVSQLTFPQCLEWHQKLRGKIVEMQTLAIKGLMDFKVARDLEGKIVAKIHEVENRAHALQSGAGGLPGQADRRPPAR